MKWPSTAQDCHAEQRWHSPESHDVLGYLRLEGPTVARAICGDLHIIQATPNLYKTNQVNQDGLP